MIWDSSDHLDLEEHLRYVSTQCRLPGTPARLSPVEGLNEWMWRDVVSPACGHRHIATGIPKCILGEKASFI